MRSVKPGESKMVSYKGIVNTDRPPAAVFAYLSDFSTAQEWDPGTVESRRLDSGDLGVGAKFRVVAEFLGRKSELTYQIVDYRPPGFVSLVGENKTVTSNDQIAVDPVGTGSRVTYTAELTFKGAARLLEPLLKLAFKPVGDKAVAGLREKLATLPGGAGTAD